MSNAPQQEPSMEEILASIRRIISDEPGQEGEAQAPAADAPSAPMNQSAIDDILELTDVVDETPAPPPPPPPPPPPAVELPRAEPPRPAVEPQSVKPRPMPSAPAELPTPTVMAPVLMTDDSAHRAADAFSRLTGGMDLLSGTTDAMGQKTLEVVVKEVLRPLLAEWLDRNLPPMVEKLVQAEIERLANR